LKKSGKLSFKNIKYY